MRMASTKKRNWIDQLLVGDKQEKPSKDNDLIAQPALRQLGITECLVCGREVAVFLTRNQPALYQLWLLSGEDLFQRK